VLLRESAMTSGKSTDGKPGTTEQLPRWEGPPETRPSGYLPAKDDPNRDRDAMGENLQDPRKLKVTDAMKQTSDDD
jgi:hypothetical protein